MDGITSYICRANGVDVNSPFTARWATLYDNANRVAQDDILCGGDIECDTWKDLADLVSDEDASNGFSVEFQTCNTDEDGEPMDDTLDWRIDWVEGVPRLACISE